MIKQKTNSKNYGNWGAFGKPLGFEILMYRDLSDKFSKWAKERDAHNEKSEVGGSFNDLSILRSYNINDTDGYGRTIGIHALIQGHTRILTLFVENGGDLFIPFIDGTNVFDLIKEHNLNNSTTWKKIESLTGRVHPELKREREWRQERSELLKVKKDSLNPEELKIFKSRKRRYQKKYQDLIEKTREQRRTALDKNKRTKTHSSR